MADPSGMRAMRDLTEGLGPCHAEHDLIRHMADEGRGNSKNLSEASCVESVQAAACRGREPRCFEIVQLCVHHASHVYLKFPLAG